MNPTSRGLWRVALLFGVTAVAVVLACSESTTKAPCEAAADCKLGEACLLGRCVPVEDEEDGGLVVVDEEDAGENDPCANVNCPSGRTCVDGACVSTCAPNATQPCGKCGTQTCGADQKWGACSGEGLCTAGTAQACSGGIQKCSSTCTWGACETGACTDGDSVPCGRCGTMSCVGGTWGACEDEGECDPGLEEACGNCGTRVCGTDCRWNGCTGQGACTPNSLLSCSTNCSVKTCGADCQWGDCSTTCKVGSACVNGACVGCGAPGEACCGSGSPCDPGTYCAKGKCVKKGVRVKAGSPEEALLKTYTKLFGERTMSATLGCPGIEIDQVYLYGSCDGGTGGTRYGTLYKALCDFGLPTDAGVVACPPTPFKYTDTGRVRFRGNTAAEATLKTHYPKIFGTRTWSNDGGPGLWVGTRHYQEAERHGTLRKAVMGEGYNPNQ